MFATRSACPPRRFHARYAINRFEELSYCPPSLLKRLKAPTSNWRTSHADLKSICLCLLRQARRHSFMTQSGCELKNITFQHQPGACSLRLIACWRLLDIRYVSKDTYHIIPESGGTLDANGSGSTLIIDRRKNEVTSTSACSRSFPLVIYCVNTNICLHLVSLLSARFPQSTIILRQGRLSLWCFRHHFPLTE